MAMPGRSLAPTGPRPADAASCEPLRDGSGSAAECMSLVLLRALSRRCPSPAVVEDANPPCWLFAAPCTGRGAAWGLSRRRRQVGTRRPPARILSPSGTRLPSVGYLGATPARGHGRRGRPGRPERRPQAHRQDQRIAAVQSLRQLHCDHIRRLSVLWAWSAPWRFEGARICTITTLILAPSFGVALRSFLPHRQPFPPFGGACLPGRGRAFEGGRGNASAHRPCSSPPLARAEPCLPPTPPPLQRATRSTGYGAPSRSAASAILP